MKLTGVETRVVEMPLVSPFRTSFGTERVRQVLVVRGAAKTAQAVAFALQPAGSQSFARRRDVELQMLAASR